MMTHRGPHHFLIVAFIINLAGFNAWAYTSEDCIKCHREGSSESLLHIAVKVFERSIHGPELMCEDCHTRVINKKHESIKGSGAVDCGQCHEQGNRHGLQSKGNNRPRCYSCHPKHRMLETDNEASAVHPGQLKKTCKGCHPAESGETGYLAWLPSIQIASHKKEDFGHAYGKFNCLGCHQGQAAHGEEEPLNDQDCYKCHLTQAGQGALWGYIHPKADIKKQPAVFAAATIYQIFLLVLLWGGFRFYVCKLSRKPKG